MATFLANHTSGIWACDSVQTYDLFFRTIFLFSIIEHGSRYVVHAGVTRHSTDEWVAPLVRNATPFGEGPRFLICDNVHKFGPCFEHAVEEMASTWPTCYPMSSKRMPFERFIGSVRRKFLDHILILSQKHGRCIIREYCAFLNLAHPHQGIDQHTPIVSDGVDLPEHARLKVIGVPVPYGLHHDYQWTA